MKAIVIAGLAAWTSWAGAQTPRLLTVADIYREDPFRSRTVADVQWLPDGTAFTFTRRNPSSDAVDIYRHDVMDGSEMLILAGGSLRLNGQPVTMTVYQTTGSQNHLLITGPQQQIWRHSFSAPYYLYDVDAKRLTALADGDTGLQNVALSPDGQRVAYVKGNNLYVADVAGQGKQQLTVDGDDNILNGVFDWVYEEEFGRPDAFRWSPDGRYIAFWRTDQSRVKTFYMLDRMSTYPSLTALKYPKVGEKNAVVRIGVADLKTGNIAFMRTGDNHNIYLPRIHWTNEAKTLAIQRLNRQQNHLELLFADVHTGATRKVLSDRDPAWVDVSDDFLFLSASDHVLWTSEKSGFRHIYVSDYAGNPVRQLTDGDWEVTRVIGVDEPDAWVYFYGKKAHPTQQQIYRVPLKGGPVQAVSQGEGWHDAVFSPDFKHYVGYFSNVRTPTRVSLQQGNGQSVRTLEPNPMPALADVDLVVPEFFDFATDDGTRLNAYMMKPNDFDPTKKYPVLVFGYGGPGSQMVVNRWGMGSRHRHLQQYLWHVMMTQKGYIVFCVDNRGTGGRGKAFKNLAYGDLSKWAVHDQIQGAKYLAKQPFVNAERIGFWGWSGGGYLACMIMLRGGEHFKAGVAVALVSDFRNYDTIWTERYMGLLAENTHGYDAANVMTYVDGLQGKLLLVHGTGDDNVHPQNTMQLVDALIAADKQFDMLLYPNRNHRIGGGNTSNHLFTAITNYIETHL